MLSNFNIEQILTFPFKETESRKNFLIAALVYFASFIVPILPLILIMGYTARIMRQVFNGDAPHMPAWDDWESMLKDGLVLFGVRVVYMLPLFIILFPLFFGMMFLPIWLNSSNGSSDALILLPFLFFGIMMMVIFPISLALGILLPAAEAHTIINGDFVAGFRIREWWSIFRANWVGFLLAYLISMIASIALTFIIQIAMITIVLICVLPFIMPAVTAYLTFVMYAAFAQAYKDGKSRLTQQA
jgi:hypothetical protein